MDALQQTYRNINKAYHSFKALKKHKNIEKLNLKIKGTKVNIKRQRKFFSTKKKNEKKKQLRLQKPTTTEKESIFKKRNWKQTLIEVQEDSCAEEESEVEIIESEDEIEVEREEEMMESDEESEVEEIEVEDEEDIVERDDTCDIEIDPEEEFRLKQEHQVRDVRARVAKVSIDELKSLLQQVKPTLQMIHEGKVPSHRHKTFFKLCPPSQMVDLRRGLGDNVFTDEQLDFIQELLREMFGCWGENIHEDISGFDYFNKVLLPESIITILSNLEGISNEEADSLLI